jgi:hypothetical protein
LNLPLDARSCWNILSTNCRDESKGSCQQGDHRKRKHAVMARAKRVLFCGFDTHRANEFGWIAASRLQTDENAKGGHFIAPLVASNGTFSI